MKGTKDYANAKVYKLISDVDDCFYIGSTCTSLHIRLQQHKSLAKIKPHIRVYSWMNEVGHENVRIILIDDDFTCDKMDHLKREEDHHIQLNKHDPNCLNMNRAHLTDEDRRKYKHDHYENNKDHHEQLRRDYYEANKSAVLQQYKEYREANKEQIKQQKRVYREANKEQIRERDKAYHSAKIRCEVCDCEISRGNKSFHIKTKKHTENLKAATV